MCFQCAAVFQRLVTEGIKHLCVNHGCDEIECRIRVRYDAEQSRLAVAQLVKLQFVIHHHVADFLNVKGSHPCAAGNQDRFCGFARRHFIFFILADSEMLRVALFQTVKHHIHRVFKGFVLLPDFGSIEHFQQRVEILFILRGFIPDIGDQRLIIQGFRLAPEIFPALAVLPFGILHDTVDQLQNVVLTSQVAERVVTHGLFKVDGIEDLDLISSALEHLSTLQNNRAFRVCDNIACVHLH